MKVALSPAQQRIAYVADLDDSGVLRTVQIGDGKIVALGGFILAQSNIEKQELLEHELHEKVLIPVIDILNAKSVKEIIIEKVGDKVVLIFGKSTIHADIVFGRYPNVEDLWEKLPSSKVSATFSSAMLKRMLKICGTGRITLFLSGVHDPMKFEAEEIEGLVMPLARC